MVCFQKGPPATAKECRKYLKRRCSDENIYETGIDGGKTFQVQRGGTNMRDIKRVYLIRLIERLEEETVGKISSFSSWVTG